MVGTNLLFSRKVFSIWKNLKYVTIGLLVLSVSLAFVLSGSEFPFGGGVGIMISNWLTGSARHPGHRGAAAGTGAGLYNLAVQPGFQPAPSPAEGYTGHGSGGNTPQRPDPKM